MNRNEQENALKGRFLRRCRSDRGSLFLEFALIAPLVTSLLFFALDFTRICRAEQQLEIASRALADVGAHLASDSFPQGRGKIIVTTYLAQTLGVKKRGSVYCRGSRYQVVGLSSLLGTVKDWTAGTSTDNIFLKIIKIIIKDAVAILTFRTDRYLFDVVTCDRGVKSSVSVWLPSYLPGNIYAYYGINYSSKGVLVVQQKPVISGWNLAPSERTRYYCHMPVIETSPDTPATYVRIVGEWIAKHF